MSTPLTYAANLSNLAEVDGNYPLIASSRPISAPRPRFERIFDAHRPKPRFLPPSPRKTHVDRFDLRSAGIRSYQRARETATLLQAGLPLTGRAACRGGGQGRFSGFHPCSPPDEVYGFAWGKRTAFSETHGPTSPNSPLRRAQPRRAADHLCEGMAQGDLRPCRRSSAIARNNLRSPISFPRSYPRG